MYSWGINVMQFHSQIAQVSARALNLQNIYDKHLKTVYIVNQTEHIFENDYFLLNYLEILSIIVFNYVKLPFSHNVKS